MDIRFGSVAVVQTYSSPMAALGCKADTRPRRMSVPTKTGRSGRLRSPGLNGNFRPDADQGWQTRRPPKSDCWVIGRTDPLGERPYGNLAKYRLIDGLTNAQEHHMESFPKISEYMDTSVPTLSPETQIMAAVDFLLRHQVTGAPVVDSNGRQVGIITETDLLKLLTEGDQGEPAAEATVAEFMTTNVITVPPAVDIYYVAGTFLANRFRRLPVVEDGKIVGAITRYDLLRVVRSLSSKP
jgi:CBS domain-containing protein